MDEFLKILWTALFLIGLGYFISIRPMQCFFKLSRFNLIIGYIISLFGGLAYFLVYSVYYEMEPTQTDTFKFYIDAEVLTQQFWEHPTEVINIFFGLYQPFKEPYLSIFGQTTHWFRPYDYGGFNDNQFVIRVNMLIMPFSMGVYAIHVLSFNLFRYLGLLFLFKLFSSFLKTKQFLFYILLLFPSLLFWASGVMKEPLVIFTSGLFCLSIYQYSLNQKKYWLLLVILSTLLGLMVKPYVVAALIIGSLVYLISRWIKPIWSFISVFLLFLVSICSIHLITPSKSIISKMSRKQIDFKNVAELSNAGSSFQTFDLQPNIQSFLLNIPEALFNGSLRPLPVFNNGLFSLVSGIETWVVTSLIVLSLLFWKKLDETEHRLILTCLMVEFIIFLIIGFTTTVEGAIVRYRIPILPFIILQCCLVFEKLNFKN